MLDRLFDRLFRHDQSAREAERKMPHQFARIESQERKVYRVRRKSARVLDRAEHVRETLKTGNWATDLLLDRHGREIL